MEKRSSPPITIQEPLWAPTVGSGPIQDKQKVLKGMDRLEWEIENGKAALSPLLAVRGNESLAMMGGDLYHFPSDNRIG